MLQGKMMGKDVSDQTATVRERAIWPRPMPFLLFSGSLMLLGYSFLTRGGFPPAVDSNLFPNLSLIILLISSGVMTVRTAATSLSAAVQWNHPVSLVSVPVVLYLYILSILSIGLVVSSVILVAAGAWALGERSIRVLGLISVSFGIFSWLMIVQVLGVYLPEALLF